VDGRRDGLATATPPVAGEWSGASYAIWQAPRVGAEKLPFAMTVKPKLVEAPAARLPLPFGRIVITFPLLSQVGLPFQVVETRCGGLTVTVTIQLLIAPLVAVIVTRPLKRSGQLSAGE
jgi:hypothetical protein